MSNSDPITILLVDDHKVVRQGVRAFLEIQDDLSVIGEAGSGKEGVKLAEQFAPDVILMDEPLGALDALTREKMQSLVLELPPTSCSPCEPFDSILEQWGVWMNRAIFETC